MAGPAEIANPDNVTTAKARQGCISARMLQRF
jgi:hypothetical protein